MSDAKMQWAPGQPLDREALKAAAQTYVKHLLDGAHKEMGCLVIVFNRKTGALHWAFSDAQADAQNVLLGALNAKVNPLAIVHLGPKA